MINLSGPIAAHPDDIDVWARQVPERPERVEVPHGYEYTRDDKRAMAGYSLEAEGVAVIPLCGFIGSDSWGTNLPRFIAGLRASKADSEVREGLIWMDTPGGSVAGISQAIQEIQAYGKPIRLYIAGMGASLGIWLGSAVGPGNISAAPEASVGGVGAVLFAVKEEAQYMVRFVSKRTPRKGAFPTSDAGKEDRQALVNDIGDLFLASVGKLRGLKGDLDSLAEQLGGGALLSAEKALALGMIDRIEVRSGPVRRSIFFGADISAPPPQPGGARRGATMDDKNPAEQVAALEQQLAAAQRELGEAKTQLGAKGQQYDQLNARLEDERKQRQGLADQVTALNQRLDADREARVKAEAKATETEANRKIDMMVQESFPEHRRDAAVQAYIQAQAGNDAWWKDILASHVPGGASHTRGPETHAGRPDPRPQGDKAADDRVDAYIKEHPGTSPADAMVALGL